MIVFNALYQTNLNLVNSFRIYNILKLNITVYLCRRIDTTQIFIQGIAFENHASKKKEKNIFVFSFVTIREHWMLNVGSDSCLYLLFGIHNMRRYSELVCYYRAADKLLLTLKTLCFFESKPPQSTFLILFIQNQREDDLIRLKENYIADKQSLNGKHSLSAIRDIGW